MSLERKHKHTSPAPDSSKQAHLEIRNEEADLSAKIDKLVSLTYDSDPAVRRNAAGELAKIDDPRSIFALLELTSDKDPQIKELALSNLNNFKGEQEAIVDLEKIFEARGQDVAQPPEAMAAARSKLMPSIEKLFFNKDPRLKARLMPSLLDKYFSTSAQRARNREISQSAAKHAQETPSPAQSSDSMPVHPSASIEIEKIESEQVQPAHVALERPSRSLTPKQQGEEAADFPLPEGLRQKTASPISEIESMLPEMPAELEEGDEVISLHPSRIDFYKWAYALAVDPKMTASKIRSEEKRLIVQLKKDVELAFRLAIKRAKETGIESLSGLKPGMKKVVTFPLLVSDRHEAVIMSGKTPTASTRLALTDGRHTVPLYIDPQRSVGINVGDHVSLHECKVDFFVETNELVFLLGKKGYVTVSK